MYVAADRSEKTFFFHFGRGSVSYHPRLREIGHIRAVWKGYSQGDKTPNAKTRTPVHLRTAQEPEPATYIPDYNNTFRVQY